MLEEKETDRHRERSCRGARLHNRGEIVNLEVEYFREK